MRLIGRIAAVPVGIAVVAFAIANRAPVAVSLDPFPFAFELPLYVVAVGALVVGLGAGAAAAWFDGRKARRLARVRKVRLAALEHELARLGERESRDTSAPLPTSADAT